MKDIFLSFRPRQWVKNLFIFLPLIFGKKLFVFPINLKSLGGFILLSMMASASYIINDIMDLEKDKLHPLKSLRPIAAGRISIKKALITAVILGVVSVTLSFILDIYFGWVIVAYLIFNLIYTLILKKAVVIDVFCIGGFFLLRVIAGSAIAKVEMSHWLIFMVVLLALFLGFDKRRYEIRVLKRKADIHRPVLSRYSSYFIDQMIAVVTSSIVVVYMLYTVDARTISTFGTKNLIFSIPFVYYGIFRYLYLAHKYEEGGDPTNILLTDRKIQLTIALWITVCIYVIYLGR